MRRAFEVKGRLGRGWWMKNFESTRIFEKTGSGQQKLPKILISTPSFHPIGWPGVARTPTHSPLIPYQIKVHEIYLLGGKCPNKICKTDVRKGRWGGGGMYSGWYCSNPGWSGLSILVRGGTQKMCKEGRGWGRFRVAVNGISPESFLDFCCVYTHRKGCVRKKGWVTNWWNKEGLRENNSIWQCY